MAIGSGEGLNRMFSGSQGMQYARMAEQLGLPPNLAQMAGAQIDAAKGDIAGMQRLLQAATQGLSTGQADAIFGKGLPPAGFVGRPAAALAAAVTGAASFAGPLPFGHGFNPFGGVSREAPFGTARVGRSIERAIKADPMFKAMMERQLGGTIIPDRRNDGKLTIWRPPFANVGGISRDLIGSGALPRAGLAAAFAGLSIPVAAGALAANAVGGSILRGLQRMEGNIANFTQQLNGTSNNVDASRNSLRGDLEAQQHANSMGIDLKNASFEDVIFLLLMKYTAKKEKEIMNKVNQLGANGGADKKGGGLGDLLKGAFGGLLSVAGGAVGSMIAPGVGTAIGAQLGGALGGAITGGGNAGGNGEVFDAQGNVGDPSKMSETAKQQALQKLMGDLQKLYEMLSNMIKSMHDMQMTPVRALRG
jgi:hypothetical protein